MRSSRGFCRSLSLSPVCVPPLVGRPGLQERARYYAVVYLNQMVLNHKQGLQAGQSKLGLQFSMPQSKRPSALTCLPVSHVYVSQPSGPCAHPPTTSLAYLLAFPQPISGPAGGSLAKRLIDVYFTVFKMILDGKIGTAATVIIAAAGALGLGTQLLFGPAAVWHAHCRSRWSGCPVANPFPPSVPLPPVAACSWPSSSRTRRRMPQPRRSGGRQQRPRQLMQHAPRRWRSQTARSTAERWMGACCRRSSRVSAMLCLLHLLRLLWHAVP